MDLVDKIIELTDLFDDNVVTTADKIPQPEPKQEVLDREAINRLLLQILDQILEKNL